MGRGRVYFSFSLDLGDIAVEELWPDGDAPENPTVKDVHALVKKRGGVAQVITDWNLLDNCDYEFDLVKITTRSR